MPSDLDNALEWAEKSRNFRCPPLSRISDAYVTTLADAYRAAETEIAELRGQLNKVTSVPTPEDWQRKFDAQEAALEKAEAALEAEKFAHAVTSELPAALREDLRKAEAILGDACWIYLNAGDTWAYACADVFELADDDIPHFIAAKDRYGFEGELAFMSLAESQHRSEPLHPIDGIFARYADRAKYDEARVWIADNAMPSVWSGRNYEETTLRARLKKAEARVAEAIEYLRANDEGERFIKELLQILEGDDK